MRKNPTNFQLKISRIFLFLADAVLIFSSLRRIYSWLNLRALMGGNQRKDKGNVPSVN
jgi:hypothetical protein